MQYDERFLIGELAEQAGVNRETLRYYERRGLLKPARRTASGYRIYNRESAARLLFIKRAQGFGFSLEEIRDLLAMKPENPRSCNRVMHMLDQKLDELAERIRQMQRFAVDPGLLRELADKKPLVVLHEPSDPLRHKDKPWTWVQGQPQKFC